MKHEALLTEIRENYDYGCAAWREIWQEGRVDMRYVSGNPWDDREKLARKVPGQERPTPAFDELGQFCNQIINDVRMNKRAIMVEPRGGGADEKTGELRANIIRDIEYKSNAQTAYSKAFEDALQRSYGYAKVVKVPVSPRSWDMELRIKRIANPDSIIPDPDYKEADGSDWKWCFEIERVRRKDFKKLYPKAKITDFTASVMNDAPGWFENDGVLIASYWRVEEHSGGKLLLLQWEDGSTTEAPEEDLIKQGYGIEDEILMAPVGGGGFQPLAAILKTKDIVDKKVYQYVTNGVEILSKTFWEGKTIPIAPCYGKEMWVDDGTVGAKKKLFSLIRLARDPYMAYCYARASQLELIGMVPKTPYVGYEGQFEGHEEEWATVNKAPHAFLQAKAVTDSAPNTVLPLPRRENYEPAIQGLEISAEAFRRAIQAAVGISALPTAAQRSNQKSGVALERIAAQQAQGSFHFIDNHDLFLQRVGDICNEMLDAVYDTPRDVGTRAADGKHKVERINESVTDEKTGETKIQELGSGEHLVTISTGPSSESQRDAAREFAESLVGTEFAPRIMDLVVRMLQLGPIGEEIAKRLTPPDIAAQQEMGDVPPAVMQKLAQQEQAIQALNAYAGQLEAALKEAESKVLAQVVGNKGKEKVALINQQTQIVTKAMDAATKQADMAAEERMSERQGEREDKAAVRDFTLNAVENRIQAREAQEAQIVSAALTPPEKPQEKQ